jgi:hypothetical protein
VKKQTAGFSETSVSDYQIAVKRMLQTLTPQRNENYESAIELYLTSDRRLSAKLTPIFADRGCHVVSVTDPYGRILGFLGRK